MSYRILVVDDSRAFRKVLIKSIKMCGVTDVVFLQAANGEEALEIINSDWVDVVFTDINMPVMDGISLLKNIKENHILGSTPIIVVTSETREESYEEFRLLGADDIIQKPCKPEIIKETLDNMLHIEGDDDGDFEGYDF